MTVCTFSTSLPGTFFPLFPLDPFSLPPPPPLTPLISVSGEGFLGLASILIAQYKPTKRFTVVRHIDLELLSPDQLEDVQHEMKVSQLFSHLNITCYLTSFLVGQHLWAVQPLMHYGTYICVCMQVCMCVYAWWLCGVVFVSLALRA